MGADGRGLSQARFRVVRVGLERDKFGVQSAPEWAIHGTLHSGVVIHFYQINSGSVARKPWIQTAYTSAGSLDLV